MTDPYAALRQALEALENSRPVASERDCVVLVRAHGAAISAARAALDAQPEPFGYVSEHNCEGPFRFQFHLDQREIYPDNCIGITTVYAAPPQRQPLPKEDLLKLWGTRSDGPDNHEIISFARAVERAQGVV